MPLTEPQIAFKAAFRRAVTLAGGPVAAARSTRAAASLLSNYGNPERPEFPPIDVCFDLDKAAGSTIILKAWADLVDCDLVPRGTAKGQSIDIAILSGELAEESGIAIKDGIDVERSAKPSINVMKTYDTDLAALDGTVVELRTAARHSIAQAS